MNTKTKTNYLVTLNEAKAHLRVDTSVEDNYITAAIKAAVEWCEQYINKDIATTTNVLVLDDFSGVCIHVNEGNLISLTSVKDENETSYPFTKLKRYDSRFKFEIAQVFEKDLTVTFVTGYSTATLPASIKQAILIKTADIYDKIRDSYQERVGSSNMSKYANNAVESFLNYFVSQKFR